MSNYFNYDHAAWVESSITAHKSRKPNATDRRRAADGRGWHAAPDKLNDFQRRAFDILGIVGGGIYNAPISWQTVYWLQPNMIGVSWRKDLSTFDFVALTKFVFLCHEARIRGGISPNGFCLEIVMSARNATGDVSRRHPNLDEALAEFRTDLSANHRIMYREPTKEIDA